MWKYLEKDMKIHDVYENNLTLYVVKVFWYEPPVYFFGELSSLLPFFLLKQLSNKQTNSYFFKKFVV